MNGGPVMSKIIMEEWAFNVEDGIDPAEFIEKNVRNIADGVGDTESVKITIEMKKGEDTRVSVNIEKEIGDMRRDELEALQVQLMTQLDELDDMEPDEADEDYEGWLMDVDETEGLIEEVTAALSELA